MQSKERKTIKWFLLGLIVLMIASFTLFQSKNLLTGPVLKINSPLDNETVEKTIMPITGHTKNISAIKLNGRNIFVNEKGDFEETVLLSYGYNTVIIEAEDRFKRKVQKELRLVLK